MSAASGRTSASKTLTRIAAGVAVMCLVLAWVWVTVDRRYTSSARATERCSANLRQLARVVSQYSARHSTFPASLGHLVYCNVLPEVFVYDLSAKPPTGKTVDESLVAWVNQNADYSLVAGEGQAESFFVYEKCTHAPDGKHLVLFADGELTQCTIEQIAKLIASHTR